MTDTTDATSDMLARALRATLDALRPATLPGQPPHQEEGQAWAAQEEEVTSEGAD